MAQQDMGLFGPSAAEVQRALDDRARLSNLEQAKLDPYQSIRLSMANYGTAAGKAIGGLFGIEDPALKEATEMDAVKKAVASQWDGQDPEKALQLFADEANKRGLTQQALSATFKLQSMKAEREKAELGKKEVSAKTGLVEAQTEATKQTSKRAEEEFDYKKSQRPLNEALTQLKIVESVQNINTRNAAAEKVQLELEKARQELEQMPEGFFKEQYKLKLEKLRADINASKALATFREGRSVPSDSRRKSAEVPIYNQLGDKIGKTVLYNDGTRETVYGNTPPSTEDTASQAAKGIVPGSNITMEQLIAERNRRKQQTGAK